MKTANHQHGFTIVEILTVLGIIASLTAVIIVSSSSARANSRDKAREVDLGQIQLAIRLYREKNGATSNPGYGQVCASCSSGINTAVQQYSGTVEDPLHDGTTYYYQYVSNSGTNQVCANRLERTGAAYCVNAP